MRLLYTGLDELLRAAQLATPKILDSPIITNMTTTMIYLGPVTDLAEVEVKADRVNKGWLYNTNTIVFFHHNDELYEIFISTIRELSLEKLAEKKIIKLEEEPSAGVMKRDANGRIIGFIAIEDLVEVSNKLNNECDYL